MRTARLSSRQLVASWTTGVIVIAAMWWWFSAWEARERAFALSDLDVARTVMQSASDFPDSVRLAMYGRAVNLQSLSAQRTLAMMDKRPAYHAAAVGATVVVVLVLIVLTWVWARLSGLRESGL